MKISLCQTAPRTGDLAGNFADIWQHYLAALNKEADICMFPELSTSGYLAEDLFLKESFIQDVWARARELIKNTGKTCLVLSMPIMQDEMLSDGAQLGSDENPIDNQKLSNHQKPGNNYSLYNAVIVAQNGKIIGTTYKHQLPNGSVFDERRYFKPGVPAVISINGTSVGMPICEDIWSPEVCAELKKQGAELFLVPNASPFEKGKMDERITHVQSRFKETQIPILYCNQALAQDGIVFDGNSFCFDGGLQIVGKSFEVDSQIIEVRGNKFHPERSYDREENSYEEGSCEEIYKAMVLGTRDYVRGNGFSKVILGLSGGIDSALVAAVAVSAVGRENVLAYMLPSNFTSQESMRDAQEMADSLGIDLMTISIMDAVGSLAGTLGLEEGSISHQNLQSRLRGTMLMAESNRLGALLLTTGNKSEYATGYATIYGDMNGAFNPVKDLYKTELYKVAHHINAHHYAFPERVLCKAPSAELSHDQKDTDSLPEYPVLDQILERYIEQRQSQAEISKDFDPEIVERIIGLVNRAEFKRKQAAPGVKISSMNFEKDRRYPITNHYK